MFYFDPLYLLFMLPAIILSFYAQFKVKYAFKKYSQVKASSGLTGAEAAQKLLSQNGIHDVRVEKISGTLSDYYDPRRKVLRLSSDIYESRSLAALGVAAHETGHALQDAREYVPMKIRNGIVPVANFGSQLAFPLIFIGFLVAGWAHSPLGNLLINLGIVAFSLAVLFQLITLPVEYNASKQAMVMLREDGLLTQTEYQPAKAVLSAAALTYVAAAASAILTLLYLVIRSQGRD